MSRIFAPPDEVKQPSSWDEIRRISDELEVKLHLAGMDARDRWRELKPRVEALERTLAETGHRATDAVTKEVAAVRMLIERLAGDFPQSN